MILENSYCAQKTDTLNSYTSLRNENLKENCMQHVLAIYRVGYLELPV